ncbi:hypothetical protein [Microbulbifer sp. MCCC 1A16149]|uniref:hypothetical protein n=1 Tax=Microbulbifer sp. MCCC 1A16149 TaxID=3411322 RepID=UPI003D14E99E
MKKIFLLIITFSMMVSCASVERGEVFESVAEIKSPLLYLYRTKRFQVAGGSPLVRLNSMPVGKVENGGYIAIRLDVGKNNISADKNVMDWNVACPELEIEAKPGAVYFAKIVVGKEAVDFISVGNASAANITWNCAIPLVDQNVAISELQGLVANSRNPGGIVN